VALLVAMVAGIVVAKILIKLDPGHTAAAGSLIPIPAQDDLISAREVLPRPVPTPTEPSPTPSPSGISGLPQPSAGASSRDVKPSPPSGVSMPKSGAGSTRSTPKATDPAQPGYVKVTSPNGTLRSLGERGGLHIGSALDPSITTPGYRALAAAQFSTITAENNMKWDAIERERGTYDWKGADAVVAIARQNDQLVRGHTLVWHSQLPPWIPTTGTGNFSKSELRSILKKHIQDEVTRYRGKIWQWDVVNEALNEDGTFRKSVWYEAWDGPGFIADAFRWAHEADPKALLFYNDYNIESTGQKSNALYDFVKGLKADGVPIDGVGFQTHLDTQFPFPDLEDNLRRFAALGLKVAETEVDVRTFTDGGAPRDEDSRAKQDQYWAKSLDACLAVPQCLSYTVWGVDDGHSWIPAFSPGQGSALLFSDRLQPKSQYSGLQKQLSQAWKVRQ
jgi:endo-1,4-beta-xylanase